MRYIYRALVERYCEMIDDDMCSYMEWQSDYDEYFPSRKTAVQFATERFNAIVEHTRLKTHAEVRRFHFTENGLRGGTKVFNLYKDEE